MNAVVDQQGMPVRIVLSQGQSSDKNLAPTLIEALRPDRDLVADRGYAPGPLSTSSRLAVAGHTSRLARPQSPTLGRPLLRQTEAFSSRRN
ncbi:transposase, partial [Bradyrhizobium sp. CCBAU 25338]|uniref:transposase n=1 Tax=Bradyrhizobium sp. CCBAU 25338 TaxID=1641877 RepID=UPI003FA4697A